MDYMFSGCASLASLTLGNNFTTDNISNNKFWRAGDFTNAVKVAPFRAYLHSTTTDAKASSFSINIADESVTAVETINAITEGAAEYYDINGHRFLQLQKGMNIVKMRNGQTKKVIIK